MPALLTQNHPRWIWLASFGGALLALLLALLMPVSWWRMLLPERSQRRLAERELAPHLWIVELAAVRPMPFFCAEPTDEPLIKSDIPLLDDDWWRRAWHGSIATDLLKETSLQPDSLLPPVLLALMDSRALLAMILAEPDSVIEATLWRLVQSDKLARHDLDGFFSAIARARSFADLKSREAAMFGDFLQETVPVPK